MIFNVRIRTLVALCSLLFVSAELESADILLHRLSSPESKDLNGEEEHVSRELFFHNPVHHRTTRIAYHGVRDAQSPPVLSFRDLNVSRLQCLSLPALSGSKKERQRLQFAFYSDGRTCSSNFDERISLADLIAKYNRIIFSIGEFVACTQPSSISWILDSWAPLICRFCFSSSQWMLQGLKRFWRCKHGAQRGFFLLRGAGNPAYHITFLAPHVRGRGHC
jgi:hypothetical protein